MFNNLFNPMYPVISNPPFMQNQTGCGLERLLLCQTNKSENKIYGSCVQSTVRVSIGLWKNGI